MLLWRAADDAVVQQGAAFAETREAAEVCRANGRAHLWCTDVPEEVAKAAWDLRGLPVRSVAQHLLGFDRPGRIDVADWLPQTPPALAALAARGARWVRVSDRLDSTTWLFIGGDPPELERQC